MRHTAPVQLDSAATLKVITQPLPRPLNAGFQRRDGNIEPRGKIRLGLSCHFNPFEHITVVCRKQRKQGLNTSGHFGKRLTLRRCIGMDGVRVNGGEALSTCATLAVYDRVPRRREQPGRQPTGFDSISMLQQPHEHILNDIIRFRG